MVRVVSCHHFESQDVFLSENEPVAFCGAQDKLLVSTVQHVVNVHDLEGRGNVLHSFSTVDIVKQIIYCESGNYVATIESKSSWHRSIVSYVRIYFKWWIDVNGQPLKVRVAGCTPAGSDGAGAWSKNSSFEMVELPLEKPALCIACCSKTSSLAVSLGTVISLFCFSTKVHPASKRTYADFDHFLDITVPFVAQQINLCENYFACMSENIAYAFKVMTNSSNGKEEDGLEIETDKDVHDENFVEWRFESCTATTGILDKKWDSHLQSKLHPDSFPINIHFQLIDQANETIASSNGTEQEVLGPRLTVRGCSVEVRLGGKAFEMFPALPSNIYAVTLLYRQFMHSESKLTALQLVPFYKSEPLKEGCADPLNAAASKSEECSFSLPFPNLIQGSVSYLKGIGCFFSTSKEGYLYDLTAETQLVSSYAYTAAMKGVMVDVSLLHALTETGLETYTVHLPHAVFHHIEDIDAVKNLVPSKEEAVCLLGLRPFLGVDHLVKSENHLVLVSSIEDSVSNTEPDGGNKSTLYSLKEPTCIQVFNDLLEVAESQKASSQSTYYHLLSEAHMILRTQIFLQKCSNKEIEALFRKSCLLLADYFLCSDSSQKNDAVPYYHLSKMPAENIIKRILDQKHQLKQAALLKPLVHYLNSLLFDEKSEHQLSVSQVTADSIITAYCEESPEKLWKVVLCSSLKGYKLDKVILVLTRKLSKKQQPPSPKGSAGDSVALAYLLLQKNSSETAETMLVSAYMPDLVTVMENIHDKLWNGKSLTSFGKLIKKVRPEAFVELLLKYVRDKRFQVPEILNVLQSESPDVDLPHVPLLKEFLEALISDKTALKEVDQSVLHLLVKIYLKGLLEPKERKTAYVAGLFPGSMSSYSLLFSLRPSWLNEMPPFNGKGISRSCLFSPKGDNKKVLETEKSNCCCLICNEDLIRLQSLLSYLSQSDDIKGEVLDVLCSAKEKHPNWTSIEVICSNETLAIKTLIGMAPKALLPYANETFRADEQKWSMLFSLLHEHMKNIPDDHPNVELYSQTFHAVLAHLSETLQPVELLALLPKGENPNFLPHVRRCVEKHQANLLKTKIVSLGQEIKSMMLS